MRVLKLSFAAVRNSYLPCTHAAARWQGSATDCQYWDWGMMAGQFITTPYDPAASAPELLRLAKANGAHLLHSPLGSATAALIPHLPSAAARAPFVAKEAATVLHSTEVPWAGTVLDFEAVPRRCPNHTLINNECVEGFTALTRELRNAMPERMLTSAMPYTPLNGYFNYTALNETLDIFALMAYDMNSDDAAGDVSGPGSRLDLILRGVKEYIKLGVPPSKLMVTLGWYGDDFVCNASGWNSSDWPRHDRCVLAYPPSGPCAPTCVDSGPAGGVMPMCFSNCTRDIGYGEAEDLYDWLAASGARVTEWMVGDDGISPFYQYISPTDGNRHQVWVDDPSALNKKVSAIAQIPGLRGTGMWTANAFHRSDQALSAKAGAEMFHAMSPRGGGGYGGLGFSSSESSVRSTASAKSINIGDETSSASRRDLSTVPIRA